MRNLFRCILVTLISITTNLAFANADLIDNDSDDRLKTVDASEIKDTTAYPTNTEESEKTTTRLTSLMKIVSAIKQRVDVAGNNKTLQDITLKELRQKHATVDIITEAIHGLIILGLEEVIEAAHEHIFSVIEKSDYLKLKNTIIPISSINNNTILDLGLEKEIETISKNAEILREFFYTYVPKPSDYSTLSSAFTYSIDLGIDVLENSKALRTLAYKHLIPYKDSTTICAEQNHITKESVDACPKNIDFTFHNIVSGLTNAIGRGLDVAENTKTLRDLVFVDDPEARKMFSPDVRENIAFPREIGDDLRATIHYKISSAARYAIELEIDISENAKTLNGIGRITAGYNSFNCFGDAKPIINNVIAGFELAIKAGVDVLENKKNLKQLHQSCY